MKRFVPVLPTGTAVLGLGNIGALAGKPVMEGKGCLFKKFAGIDVFDIDRGRSRRRRGTARAAMDERLMDRRASCDAATRHLPSFQGGFK